MTSAYVETSALAKLVLDEAESAALHRALGTALDGRVTSELTWLELGRAAHRRLGDLGLAKARAAFLRFETLPIDRLIVDRAALIEPAELRSLDAIHVATALAIGSPDLVFYAYDRRTLEAARANGLTVASPGT